jgi:hypothetical protein
MKFNVYMINGDFTFSVSKKDLQTDYGLTTVQTFLYYCNHMSLSELIESVENTKGRRIAFGETGIGGSFTKPNVFDASILRDLIPLKVEAFPVEHENFAFIIKKKDVKSDEDIELLCRLVHNQHMNLSFEWFPSKEYMKDVLDSVEDKEFAFLLQYFNDDLKLRFIKAKFLREGEVSILLGKGPVAIGAK